MKVAYIFSSPRAASYVLAQMILPQLEAGIHGAQVVAMFFLHDNVYALRKGDPVGERLANLAEKDRIILMLCDSCALERGLAAGQPKWCGPDGRGLTTPNACTPVNVVSGVQVGCFPDLYRQLENNMPDQVITL